MTARDEMAVLYERVIIGEERGTARYDDAYAQAAYNLDAIASLATNPETAPAVFRWLVEAGVLWETCAGDPWHQHYHMVLGER